MSNRDGRSYSPRIRCVAPYLTDSGPDRRGGSAGVDTESASDLIAELVATGPPGWQHLEAAFAMTVTSEAARMLFDVGDRSVQVEVPAPIMDQVRRLRSRSAGSVAGPWWRLLVRAGADGTVEFDADYGEEPFPDGPLFPPEAYRADVAAYPRPRLPVWLAAYMFHDGRQTRSAARAAMAVIADRAAGLGPTPVEDDLPPLPPLWARWALLAAAYTALGSDAGPRVSADTGWFETRGYRPSGSALHVRADGTAVLSGGVWDAPALNAAYNGGIDLPDLFAGAPDWVTDEVLNARASVGMLSFCFWWDGTGWYRGESPTVLQCGVALPGMWSGRIVVETVARMLARPHAAVWQLLRAAECGELTRELVTEAFGSQCDIDAAVGQLRAAGSISRRLSGGGTCLR
jgi:hypothetical protein